MTDNRAPDDEHPRALLIGAASGGLAALIWAGWMVFTRMGVQLSLNAYDITALRFGVGGPSLAAARASSSRRAS